MKIKRKMADSLYFELSDNEIYDQLSETKSRDFRAWNGTSLENLFIACSGYNGEKIKIQAINLLIDFCEWYKVYIHRMRPPWLNANASETKILEKTIDYVQKNSVDVKDAHGLRQFQKRFDMYKKFHELF